MLVLDARGIRRSTGAPVLLTGEPGDRRARVAGDGAGARPARADRPGRRPGRDPVGERSAGVLAPPGAGGGSAAERLRAGLRASVDRRAARRPGPAARPGHRRHQPHPADLTAAMRATGMTHLTAVSGSNVAVVTGLVLGLCVAARRAAVGCDRCSPSLALAGFVVLARPEPSVVRAAAMGAIGLIGLSRSRRSAGPPVLGAAIVVVLVVDPWLARSFGFALSSLATLGLLLFTRPWGDAIGARLPPTAGPARSRARHPGRGAGDDRTARRAAPGLGQRRRRPRQPARRAARAGRHGRRCRGRPHLRRLARAAPRSSRGPGSCPTAGIAQVARRFAEVPGGTLPWPDGAPGALLLAALTVAVLLTGRALAAGVAAHPVLAARHAPSIVAAALVPTRAVTWPPDGWRVVVCDVGQGDAVVLRSGPHRAVLVDAGPDPPLGRPAACSHLGVDTLDAVVLTHFHADHVDGLSRRARRARASRSCSSARSASRPTSADAGRPRRARAHGIPVAVLHAGDRLTVGEVDAAVWSPWRRIADGSVPNNASLVLAARTGAVDALLLGDVEREAAHDLLLRCAASRRWPLAATGFEVVKTPHHGSANLDDDLMAAVAAPVGVISVGRGQRLRPPGAAPPRRAAARRVRRLPHRPARRRRRRRARGSGRGRDRPLSRGDFSRPSRGARDVPAPLR